MTISTDSLIEKQKTQLNLILNWAKSQSTTVSTKSNSTQLDPSFLDETTVSSLIQTTVEECSPCNNSLSYSSNERPHHYETSSFYDSLNEPNIATNSTNLSYEELNNNFDKVKYLTNSAAKLE
jgi:hypothetical protein